MQYVHQFLYRSTSGRVFNAMHFFNNGSLPANVALMQLFYCIMSCELVGCRVFDLVCDAAGSMQRLFTYLRKKTKLTEDAWLAADCVRFRNPFDRSRWIFMHHCSTHNCKNMRTQTWNSQPTSAVQPKTKDSATVDIVQDKSVCIWVSTNTERTHIATPKLPSSAVPKAKISRRTQIATMPQRRESPATPIQK